MITLIESCLLCKTGGPYEVYFVLQHQLFKMLRNKMDVCSVAEPPLSLNYTVCASLARSMLHILCGEI